MNYLQVNLYYKSSFEGYSDLLIAQLAESGFEGFIENDSGISAFIPEEKFERTELNAILNSGISASVVFRKFIIRIPPTNWNAEWEKDYSPVCIDDFCEIRASFHKKSSAKYEIIIDPQMSFGTGHHETTRLMIRMIRNSKPENKTILDMGCGTGVLGIFAIQNKAKFLTAIDIDPNACKNSEENLRRNNITENKYTIIQGEKEAIPPSAEYDIILANINRNILLSDIQFYYSHLVRDGSLILSGILLKDKSAILENALELGLRIVSELTENNWISIKLRK